MKRLRNLLSPLVLCAGGLMITNAAQGQEIRLQIHAMGAGQVNFSTSSSTGVIRGAGVLNGTTLGEFVFTGPNTYEGTFTITTRFGVLILHEFDGVFNAQTGAFSNNSEVIDGTGIFEDATGGLFFEGAVAPDGSYTDKIIGEIDLESP